jgi:hypothetical protein
MWVELYTAFPHHLEVCPPTVASGFPQAQREPEIHRPAALAAVLAADTDASVVRRRPTAPPLIAELGSSQPPSCSARANEVSRPDALVAAAPTLVSGRFGLDPGDAAALELLDERFPRRLMGGVHRGEK